MFKNLSLKNLGIGVDLRESLRLASLGGFESIDLDMEKVAGLCTRHGAGYVRGMLDSFSMRPGTWELPVDLSAAQEDFQKAIMEAGPLISAACEISATRAIIELPAGSDRLSMEDFTGILPHRISTLLVILSGSGCMAGIKAPDIQNSVKPYSHTYRFTQSRILEICREIGDPNAGIVLDTFLRHREGAGMDDIGDIKSREIVCVQASDEATAPDTGRRLPGETGRINLRLFLETLDAMGYEGPVTPFSEAARMKTLPHEIATILSGGYLKSIWKESVKET